MLSRWLLPSNLKLCTVVPRVTWCVARLQGTGGTNLHENTAAKYNAISLIEIPECKSTNHAKSMSLIGSHRFACAAPTLRNEL